MALSTSHTRCMQNLDWIILPAHNDLVAPNLRFHINLIMITRHRFFCKQINYIIQLLAEFKADPISLQQNQFITMKSVDCSGIT